MFRDIRAVRALAGTALLFLASCAAPPAPETAAPADAAPAPAPAPSAANGTPAPAPQVAAAPPVAGARALVGLSREAVSERYGAAGFVRRDGPAEVWRYRARECFLELFLYRETDGSQRVAHVDARNFAGRSMPADTCLARLDAERRG
jgi:hypothetical protein